jgi:hypothetical protein
LPVNSRTASTFTSLACFLTPVCSDRGCSSGLRHTHLGRQRKGLYHQLLENSSQFSCDIFPPKSLFPELWLEVIHSSIKSCWLPFSILYLAYKSYLLSDLKHGGGNAGTTGRYV